MSKGHPQAADRRLSRRQRRRDQHRRKPRSGRGGRSACGRAGPLPQKNSGPRWSWAGAAVAATALPTENAAHMLQEILRPVDNVVRVFVVMSDNLSLSLSHILYLGGYKEMLSILADQ
jgi:hypothetical protein